MASKTLFLLKLIQKASWFCFGKSVFLLTERYRILTWDPQCRLLEDRNGFSFLLHIPWIFICRPQEVSEALHVPMVYVSLTFSRVMASTPVPVGGRLRPQHTRAADEMRRTQPNTGGLGSTPYHLGDPRPVFFGAMWWGFSPQEAGPDSGEASKAP